MIVFVGKFKIDLPSLKGVMTYKSLRSSLTLTATVMCACLYAIGSYLTAYIPSPWGFGQFRPAVVVPSLFAVVFGPLPAGVGAALGTLMADSVKHGYLYPGSYLAAVPGNFLGFYLFGYLTRRFTWRRFILASHLTLTTANFVVAFLYVVAFKLLYLGEYTNFPPEAFAILIVGLTIWWYVTMLPFVLLVTPILSRAVAAAYPSLVSQDVKLSLKEELPQTGVALLIPGLIMLLTGLATTYTSLGEGMMNFFGSATVTLIELMFYVSGAVLTLLGIFFKKRPKADQKS